MGFLQRLLGFLQPPRTPPIYAGMIVASEAIRCVQCGVCGYNCPADIDVRTYARQGLLVTDPRCILCGNCVEKCPRGTLFFIPRPEGAAARPAYRPDIIIPAQRA